MRRLAQRVIKGMYSATAARLYEPIVVRRALPLVAGDIEAFLLEQGRRAVAAAQGRPVLDLPVGTAYFTIQIAADHEGLTVGADIAPGMVEQAARRARRAGRARLVVLQADVHRLPFGDGTFAAALCHNGLQVMPDLRGALREFARVLEPGGMFLASVVHAPVGALLPPAASGRLPTLLRSGRDVAAEFERAGLQVVALERNRLTYFVEAVKLIPRPDPLE